MVALLVRNGGDPSQANDDGDIPLYIAVRNGYNVISGILLHKSEQSGADANWKTDMGETLLNIAIEKGYEQVARILLDFGADIEGMDYMENTGLNIATEQGNIALVKLLMKQGADFDHPNIMGTTPIMAAAQKGHTELYRGAEYQVDFLPKVKLEIATQSENVDRLIEAISSAAYTGKIGDGKIFVYDLKQVVRIRTGEMDSEAI